MRRRRASCGALRALALVRLHCEYPDNVAGDRQKKFKLVDRSEKPSLHFRFFGAEKSFCKIFDLYFFDRFSEEKSIMQAGVFPIHQLEFFWTVPETSMRVCITSTLLPQTLQDGDYAKPICSGRGKNVLGNNSIFSPTGAITECGATLAAWQAQVSTGACL